MRIFLTILLSFPLLTFAAPEKVVNVYAWGGEIPKKLIQAFEQEHGIKVQFATFDNNETMYAKLKTSTHSTYDVILLSGYFVERMKKQAMLTHLDHSKLPHLKNIDSLFIQNGYDDNNQFSIPLVWGATGIFYNQKEILSAPLSWKSLWEPRWKRQLMLLDDTRDVFGIALMSLGLSPNDNNPHHIQQAYEKLLALNPNIKLFASDSIQSIMIDRDAIAGSAWNGDAFKAHAENSDINFVYPKEGFVIWVDCLAIPKKPPHPDAAYLFIDFMLRPTSAQQIALIEGHAITNKKAKEALPAAIRDNPMVYPSADTLKRGYFQRDLDDEALLLYNHYWERLKLSF